MNWDKYPNFSEEEFACSETGECKMSASFMKKMQSKSGLPLTPYANLR